MSDAVALLEGFPTMFAGPHLGLVLYRGWAQILFGAFGEIDRVLAGRTCAFHWVYLEEDGGFARCVYSLGERWRYVIDIQDRSRRALPLVTSDEPKDLVLRIDGIVFEMERLTGESCIICGAPATRESHFGRLLPLCCRHHPDLVNKREEAGLEGIWREAILVEVARSHQRPGSIEVMGPTNPTGHMNAVMGDPTNARLDPLRAAQVWDYNPSTRDAR